VPPETRELPATAPAEPWLPPPGTYTLNPSSCITEFAVRVLGARIRGRLTPVDGELTIDEAPRRSTMRVDADRSATRWSGIPPLRQLLARWWRREDDGEVIRLETERMRFADPGRFRVHGNINVAGRTVPAVLAMRVIHHDDSQLLMMATTTLSRAAVTGKDTSRIRRLLLRRRFRLLFAAEFQR
jgi:polyisoprenoid-binding protein YceI